MATKYVAVGDTGRRNGLIVGMLFLEGKEKGNHLNDAFPIRTIQPEPLRPEKNKISPHDLAPSFARPHVVLRFLIKDCLTPKHYIFPCERLCAYYI